MPKAQKELDEVTRHLSSWITEISVNNALTYFDINKVSEGTSLYLLNLLFGWELEDLNDQQQNFPGIDLGDKQYSKLAVQVTSRTDPQKIKSTLQSFVENNYLQSFTNGLRFLLLSSEKKPVLSDSVVSPYLNFFDPKKDILSIRDLLLQAKKLYYEKKATFKLVKQFLEQEFGNSPDQLKKGLISFDSTDDKIQFFKRIFAANQDIHTKNFVPIEYVSGGQSYSSDILHRDWTDDGLIIYGPSGCGKSALARQLSLKVLDQVFPVILEAKYYKNSLQSLFDKEVRAYGFDSDTDFLEASARYEQRVLLILDGLNECKPELRSKLILETTKAFTDRQLKLIITVQIQEPVLEEFKLKEIYVQRPSLETRQAIALAYSPLSVGKKLTPILAVISTGLEAKMIGEMSSTDQANNNRFSLFAAFIRMRLGNATIGGFLLMTLIARYMSEKITFSISVRSLETLLLNQPLTADNYKQCLLSGVLDERSGKISYTHEMFFNFFVAESIARFVTNSTEILKAISAPKNADKKLLIIGAIEDRQLLDQVLAGISDYNVFNALLEGEGGEFAQLLVNKKLAELLPKIAAEIGNFKFEFAETPHHFQCVESSLSAWSHQDLGLLFAIPGRLTNGVLLEQILDMTGLMDDKCAIAVREFSEEAEIRNISARSIIFHTTYNSMCQKKLAISRLFSSLQSGFPSLGDRINVTEDRLQQIIKVRQLKPGQIYLLFLLFRYDDRLQLLYLTALDVLKRWRQVPFHLLSEVLQQIRHLYTNDEQRAVLINAITTIHAETENIWLSTEILDALSALGELEQDANDYIPVVNQEIANVLNKPTDINAFEVAVGIFFRQYDHPYDSAYYTAIDQLPDGEKELFLKMALQGSHSSMFTISLIMKAYALLGDGAMEYLIKWTETPFIDPTFPVNSLGIFLVVHLLLGQHNHPLPSRDLNGPDKKENSIRALAEIYYWLNIKNLPNDQQILQTEKLAALFFKPENIYVIETIWQSRHALYQKAHYGKLDLSKLQLFEVTYRQQIANTCRQALTNLNWQDSIWQFGQSRKEINQHAISLLSNVGSIIDIDVLRSITDDANYGRYAVDAIKNLGG